MESQPCRAQLELLVTVSDWAKHGPAGTAISLIFHEILTSFVTWGRGDKFL